MHILGISAYYHDSAAALVRDGELVAAAQEERFTRKKHDPAFPANAVRYCLDHAGVAPDGIDAVAFYEKPLTHFVRLLRTYLATAPAGFRSFHTALPLWLREKLWIGHKIETDLADLGYERPEHLWFAEHHESHAASAFYPSPFESAAVLTFDGVGEWATSSIGVGRGHEIELVRQLNFPHSLGLLYSAFTYYCGFRVNSGEYKLMGLAPYGEPRFVDAVLEHLIDLHDDGSFTVNRRYFGYLSSLRMTNGRFDDLFGGPPRAPESDLTRREMDLAASVQAVTEEVVLRMARTAASLTGERRAVLAGGVALNCVANGRLLREGPFDDLWIQPAAGDAGGAVGAALWGWHQVLAHERVPARPDGMHGAFLGPSWTTDEIAAWLDGQGYPYRRLGEGERGAAVADLVARGDVVGLFQGRMEFGPRALGHRSIIGDPRSPEMQSVLNLKIKYRESFRPFAPAVLEERVADVFDHKGPSPYMLIVADVREDRWVPCDEPPQGRAARGEAPGATNPDLREWVNQVRSDLPAITHVDHSARIQTVDRERNPEFHAVLTAFEARTGCPVLINTSFNVRGEPIVATPEDAYRCFRRTEMDSLVLEDLVLEEAEQPPWTEGAEWTREFTLD
jgi:carbamoyltransferase